MNFAVPVDDNVIIKKKKKTKEKNICRLPKKQKKDVEHESDADTNCCWYPANGLHSLGKESGENENFM